MFGLVRAVMRARAVRPLLWWVLGVPPYVVVQPRPAQYWMLVLIVGLGVALVVTVRRLRASGRERGERVWRLVERLGVAIADRIQRGQHPLTPLFPASPHGGYGQVGSEVHGQRNAPRMRYDAGALVSAVAAVVAAEGLPTSPAPALPVVARLLTGLGISPQPGARAATAWGVVEAVQPAVMVRPCRAMPPGLLASVIRAVLTQDRVLPQVITVEIAEDLITDSATVLAALGIDPVNDGGGLDQWPIVADIINAAPLPAPIHHWGR